MRAISAALTEGRTSDAAQRAIALEVSLRAETPASGAQLGWARYLSFRAAYELGDHARAYDLLLSLDEQRHRVVEPNRAWMYSLGCELAAKHGDIDDIDLWGQRCYAIRRKLGSVDCALRCALLVCRLLERAGALAKYPHWPERVIAIGRAYRAGHVVSVGTAFSKGTSHEQVARGQLRPR
jgi:hypothetical protein